MAPGYVVSADQTSKEILVWSLPDRQLLYRLKTETQLTDLILTQDDRVVAGSQGEQLQAWSLQDGKPLWSVSGSRDSSGRLGGYAITPGPAGRYAFTRGACGPIQASDSARNYDIDPLLRIWDLGTGKLVGSVPISNAAARSGKAVQDWLSDDRLLVTSETGVEVAAAPDWKPKYAGQGDLTYAAVSPDRSTVAIAWGVPRVDLIPAAEVGRSPGPIPRTVPLHFRAVLIFLSDRWLLSQSIQGAPVLIDVDKAEVAATFPARAFSSVSNSSTGRFLLFANNQLQVWQGPNRLFSLPSTQLLGEFSPDGKFLLTYNPSSPTTVKIWDAATGVEVSSSAHPFSAGLIHWSQDGRWVVGSNQEGGFTVWEVSEGKFK